MSDREALAAALEGLRTALPSDAESPAFAGALNVALDAARERLAQLPENDPACTGTGKVFARNPHAPSFVDGTHLNDCPTCHSSGKVYPAELVEQGTRALMEWQGRHWDTLRNGYPIDLPLMRLAFVAVLDALNSPVSVTNERS